MTDNLIRKLDESELEFKKRVYSNKDAFDLTWQDIADLLNDTFGTDYSADKYRKESYAILEDIRDNDSYTDLTEKLFEIKKEKVKATDERIQANAIIRELAREEVFREIALDAVKEISDKKYLDKPKEIEEVNTEKIGILCLGDWHYGLDVDVFYNKYNPEIAVERVNKLLDKVINIVKEHKLKEIMIVNLGDMISGRIHLPLRLNSRIDTVTQTIQVSELLSEFLTELSKKVVIKYTAVEDNHSRIEPNKRDSLQTESFARIIDWYLQERLHDNKNIKFVDSKINGDMQFFKVFSHNVVAVHGDKDPQRGIIDKLNSYMHCHMDMILSAHLHHFSADENSETEFYCNGSLIGQDQYAADLRLTSKPSQLMFISTPDNVSEVLYKIKL